MRTPLIRETRSAFTLIELLIVIGIVIVLAALLLPIMGKATESSKIVTCTSNLRQLGVALLGYATANDRYLPPMRLFGIESQCWWAGKAGDSNVVGNSNYRLMTSGRRPLNQYIGVKQDGLPVPPAQCPSDEGSKSVNGYSTYDFNGTSYWQNQTHDPGTLTGNSGEGLSLLLIKRPGRMIAMAEAGAYYDGWYPRPAGQIAVISQKWHRDGKYGVLFVDGSVGRFSMSQADQGATPAWTFYIGK